MIAIVTGLMNSGKTLFVTFKLFLAFINGNDILTNFSLTFPHYEVNKDWFHNLAKEETILKNVSIGIDEAWLFMGDSRRAMSEDNIMSSYFFLQSSKDDTEIYLTAQHIGQLDNRIRNNCHKIIECSRVIKYKNKYYPINEEKRFLEKKYTDILYIKAVEYKAVNLGGFRDYVVSKTYYVNAKNIFKLYDTTQKMLKL